MSDLKLENGTAMKTIQLDMFAVGLGAAVLTQFALEDGSRVTVLADGGMETGRPPEGVLSKLSEALDSFLADGPRRIDLIVGTHYDGDHLKGLLPIVEDKSIEIGDVWLPPLKNDTQEILGTVEAEDFLAGQFFDDEDYAVLHDYLLDKAHRVEELQNLENEAFRTLRSLNMEGKKESWRPLPNYQDEGSPTMNTTDLRRRLKEASPEAAVKEYHSFFESHEADAIARTGIGSIHESGTYDSRYPDVLDIVTDIQSRWEVARVWPWEVRHHKSWEWLFSEYQERARIVPVALATIRKSEASGAITATHLAKVAEALRNRRPPIRPRCPFVAANRPSRFAWSPTKRKFVRRESDGETDLVLTLLGPSEQLIQKHCAKLPIGTYVASLLLQEQVIYRESITPSNQLSYIFTLEMKGQRVLISGDAGCYGFRERGRDYYKELLRPLVPVHVVQIAHHGGHNYDFYEALLKAGFAKQENHSFLLLSHATRDKHRPSQAFEEFVARIRREDNEVSLLFTSVPKSLKVENYRELIHAVVPPGQGSKEGDIRLSYQADGNSGWIVERHAVKV